MRGYLSGGICPGVFVGGYLSGGICPGIFVRGYLSGGICPGVFVLIPTEISKNVQIQW